MSLRKSYSFVFLLYFKADDFLARGDEGSRFEDCFLALTGNSILLFNCDRNEIRKYRKLGVSDLDEVKARPEKNQFILVSTLHYSTAARVRTQILWPFLLRPLCQ